jgi:hypothetical protein
MRRGRRIDMAIEVDYHLFLLSLFLSIYVSTSWLIRFVLGVPSRRYRPFQPLWFSCLLIPAHIIHSFFTIRSRIKSAVPSWPVRNPDLSILTQYPLLLSRLT